MNILLLLAHSIAEYDDLRMFSDLGYDVFSIGAYTDPRHPADDKRPALPDAPWHPELAALVEGDQMAHKAHLPDGLIDWADVIIAHHYVEDWIVGNWPRIKHKRVIWRTCGQSDPRLEMAMRHLRPLGLQIVRYSPKERLAFEPMGVFAGEDALIRFGKYPADWYGWTGQDAPDDNPYGDRKSYSVIPWVGNITQNMAGRGEHVGLSFWQAATEGLPTRPAGPGSDELPGGIGTLGYDEMREYLRRCRAYLYTGTQPASYTLGLIEAMMTGTPVVSIGPKRWGLYTHPALFEAHELAPLWVTAPSVANVQLRALLSDPEWAAEMSGAARRTALDLFDVAKVGKEWVDFLGSPAVPKAQAVEVAA